MDEGNLPILVDAKTEYTKQLIGILSPDIYFGIKKIYNDSKNKAIEKEEQLNTLSLFQESLSEIPNWNQHIINDKYESIMQNSKCDWLEDLITAVFVSHTRILTSINFSKNKNKINLQIPKVDYFIHQCFIEVAREFWKNPYLFDDSVNNFEYQRNRRDAETIIESTIGETIRKQLPVKNILKEYLGNDYSEDDNENFDKPNKLTDNLRKMVKNEIENCSKEKLSALNIEKDDEENDSDGNPDENKISSEEIKEFKNTDTDFLEKDAKIYDESGNELKVESVNNEIELDDIDKLINSEVDKIDLVSENDFNLDAKKIDDNIQDLSELKEVYIDEKTDETTPSQSATEESSPSQSTTEESAPSQSSPSQTTTEESSPSQSTEELKKSDVTEELIKSDVTETTPKLLDSTTEVNNSDSGLLSEVQTDLGDDLVFSSLDDLDFDINNLESDNETEDILQNEQNNEVVKLEESQTNTTNDENNLSLDSIKNTETDENVKTIIIDTKQVYDKKKNSEETFEFDDNLEDKDLRLRRKVLSKYKKKRDYSFFQDATIE